MASNFDFKLPEKLTIANINHLHEDLENLLGKRDCDKIVLKADTVLRADTAGLQLLLSFVMATKEGHIDLVWKKPSKSLREAAQTLGLENSLGMAS